MTHLQALNSPVNLLSNQDSGYALFVTVHGVEKIKKFHTLAL